MTGVQIHSSAPAQAPTALMLCGTELCTEERNLLQMLTFFGVRCKTVPAATSETGCSDFCLLSSASCMVEVMQRTYDLDEALPRWMLEARSIYLYGFQDTDSCRQLLRLLTGDDKVLLQNISAERAWTSVTANCVDMCGPMSGLRIQARIIDDLVCRCVPQREDFESIIKLDAGYVFFRVVYRHVPFYLNVSRRILDISASTETYFDVSKHFSEAVPTTMYVKWAFREVCWTSGEPSACIIVDDVVLKPRHGFLKFREMLKLMDKYAFATTIAFIPHNWRRTDARTVDILRQRSDISLCVHGCDHVALEFATRSSAVLNQRLKLASHRMDLLRRKSALTCEHVMVFPQGAFSPETGYALKANNYGAAVNTEVAPWRKAGNETTIRDLWSVAIMKYGSFPIFTRRYLTQGIENFAFDGLLGKPTFLATHHDGFKDNGRDLMDFIARLNSLKWRLCWRTLGDAIARCYRVRREIDGSHTVQMFANNLIIDNPFSEPIEVLFMKEESNPECLEAVTVNHKDWPVSFERGTLQFKVLLQPKEVMEIRVVYRDRLGKPRDDNGLGYKVKTRWRRYLSELRDNYLANGYVRPKTD